MTAREFLEQYGTAYNKALRLKEKHDQLREEYDSVGGSVILTRNDNDISKPTERKAERVQKAFDEWANAQLDAVEIMQSTFGVIMAVKDMNAVDVLLSRYLYLLSWDEIVEKTGYCKSQLFRFHREGMKQIEQLIN